MTIYQKAIKVKKYCEKRTGCDGCIYRDKCRKSENILLAPIDENLINIAKAIQIEKWKVK